MAFEIIVSDSYERELFGILAYHYGELSAPSAAKDLMEKLDGAVGIIAQTPEVKAASSKPVLGRMELREWFACNYVIVYRFDGEAVYLEHIFHQSQDYAQLI